MTTDNVRKHNICNNESVYKLLVEELRYLLPEVPLGM
jgi:hypothetical protein